jgi:hypothetical protein
VTSGIGSGGGEDSVEAPLQAQKHMAEKSTKGIHWGFCMMSPAFFCNPSSDRNELTSVDKSQKVFFLIGVESSAATGLGSAGLMPEL